MKQFPGYLIGDNGTVWSCKQQRARQAPDGRVMGPVFVDTAEPRRCLKATKDGDGYLQVGLYVQPKRVVRKVHRLVCEAFCGPQPSLHHQVAHNNGDKLDNRAENLRWATAKENCCDQIRHGTTLRGKLNPNVRLTEDQVVLIRKDARSAPATARDFGVSPATILQVRNRRTWQHVE